MHVTASANREKTAVKIGRGLIGAAMIFLGLSMGSFQTLGDAPAESLPTKSSGVPPLGFRPDEDGEAHRFAVAATFLILLAVGGFAAVRYGKRQFPLRLRATDIPGGIRLLSARRVTPRLTLVKVLLDDYKTVVIADNGTHLLLVSESTESFHASKPIEPNAT